MIGFLLQISTTPATPVSAVDFTWLFIKMMIALAVVCVLAVIIIKYAVPRFGFLQRFGGGRHVEILSRQPLEPRKNLYVVRIGGRYALIGTSEHGVNLIMELAREDVKDSPPPSAKGGG